MRRHLLLLLLLPLLAAAPLLVAACGGGSTDRSGGPAGPTVIRVGEPGASSDVGAAFAAAIAELSGGSLDVQLVAVEPDASANPEPRLLADVRAGRVDVAVVPARAFSAAGVASPAALSAPFSVESDAHAAAIARDDAVARDVFGGLGAAGLEGLAVVPRGLRHGLGTAFAPRSLADFQGRLLRSVPSDETWALWRALGASPVFAATVTVTADGRTIELADGSLADPPFSPALAAADVVPYARFDLVVADAGMLAGLSERERGILRTAAERARDATIAALPGEVAAAAAICADGGSIVLAGAEAVAELRAATAPVTATLARDPAAARVLARIAALDPGADAQPAPCAAPDVPEPPARTSTGSTAFDGVYRIEVRDEDLPGVDDAFRDDIHGVWTWTFRKGTWAYDQSAANPLVLAHMHGVLAIEGDRFALYNPDGGDQGPPEGINVYGRWRFDEEGRLVFSDLVETADAYLDGAALYFPHPLTPVDG